MNPFLIMTYEELQRLDATRLIPRLYDLYLIALRQLQEQEVSNDAKSNS